jgi:transcriptional regulator with XRE-family HTH domain
MATRKSGPLDAMVGATIRMLRVDRGMSQAALAERVGVTPQQLQKYERGTSRIGGGRLSLFALALGVSVGELFEAPEGGTYGAGSLMRVLADPGVLRMFQAYARTTDPRVRLCLAKLVESIADRTPEPKATVTRLDGIDRGEPRRSPFQG